MNFVCNVVYVYVRYVRNLATVGCRFQGEVNPTRSSGIRTDTVSVTVNSIESTGPLYQFSGPFKL